MLIADSRRTLCLAVRCFSRTDFRDCSTLCHMEYSSRSSVLCLPNATQTCTSATLILVDRSGRKGLWPWHRSARIAEEPVSVLCCPKADLIASHPLHRQNIFAITLVTYGSMAAQSNFTTTCFVSFGYCPPPSNAFESTLDTPRMLLVANYTTMEGVRNRSTFNPSATSIRAFTPDV